MSLLMDALKQAEVAKKKYSVTTDSPVTTVPTQSSHSESEDKLLFKESYRNEDDSQWSSISLTEEVTSESVNTFTTLTANEYAETEGLVTTDNTTDTANTSASMERDFFAELAALEASSPMFHSALEATTPVTPIDLDSQLLPEFKKYLEETEKEEVIIPPPPVQKSQAQMTSWLNQSTADRELTLTTQTTTDNKPPVESTANVELTANNEIVKSMESVKSVASAETGDINSAKTKKGFYLREWQKESAAVAPTATIDAEEDNPFLGPSPLELGFTVNPATHTAYTPPVQRPEPSEPVPKTTPETAQRVLAASASAPPVRLKILLGLLGFILVGFGAGGYYYYTLSSQSGVLINPSKLSHRPLAAVSSPLTKPTLPVKDTHYTKPSVERVNTVTEKPMAPVTASLPSAPIAPATAQTQPGLLTADPSQTFATAKSLAGKQAAQQDLLTATPSNQTVATATEKSVKASATQQSAAPMLDPSTVAEKSSVSITVNPPVSTKSAVATPSTNKSANSKAKSASPPLTISSTDSPSSNSAGPTASTIGNSSAIQLKKALVKPLNVDITEGYSAFQRGDISTATKSYTKALQQDSNNRDALLGLAAIAVQRHQPTQAQKYYQRVLTLYPQDTYAQVGLMTTLNQATPETESQLKLLLDKSPQSAYLHFNLGNWYANQGRWNQAQSAYFNAYRYDNTKADYVYNLAISLDQLNQFAAALSYYQMGVQMALYQSVSFNISTVQRRIQTLLNHAKTSALSELSKSSD